MHKQYIFKALRNKKVVLENMGKSDKIIQWRKKALYVFSTIGLGQSDVPI